MVFSSPAFLFYFLPVTLLLAYLVDRYKWRNSVLLFLSLIFYAVGEGEMLLIMFGSITMNYFIGNWISRDKSTKAVTVGIILNLLLLIVFKYTSFIIENVNVLLSATGITTIPQVHIKLPIGISFYTFHSMSYLIDVYRRQNESQKSFVDLALYICLFPQLVAGPIIRYKDVAEQFRNRVMNSFQFHQGLERFIIGLGKKVVIANSLGYVVDQIFELNTMDLTAPAAWFGIICYAMQLYFDFSGYSDMAIGLGKMVGFNFLENFRFPYVAKSIREFWQRWHISLSNWFRDYLYIPLGGNRVSAKRVYLNLFIVFFLTGLWHGASWNFVIWGMIHGLFMIIERLGFEKLLQKTPALVQRFYMLFVVLIAWVFFRAEHLDDALNYVHSMFVFSANKDLHIDVFLNSEIRAAFIVGIIMAFNGFNRTFRMFFKYLFRKNVNREMIKTIFRNVKSVFLIIVLIYSALVIAVGSYNPFIYFRF